MYVGEIGFSVPSYTFVENVGMGVVIVNGPADFPPTLSVQLVGGTELLKAAYVMLLLYNYVLIDLVADIHGVHCKRIIMC